MKSRETLRTGRESLIIQGRRAVTAFNIMEPAKFLILHCNWSQRYGDNMGDSFLETFAFNVASLPAVVNAMLAADDELERSEVEAWVKSRWDNIEECPNDPERSGALSWWELFVTVPAGAGACATSRCDRCAALMDPEEIDTSSTCESCRLAPVEPVIFPPASLGFDGHGINYKATEHPLPVAWQGTRLATMSRELRAEHREVVDALGVLFSSSPDMFQELELVVGWLSWIEKYWPALYPDTTASGEYTEDKKQRIWQLVSMIRETLQRIKGA